MVITVNQSYSIFAVFALPTVFQILIFLHSRLLFPPYFPAHVLRSNFCLPWTVCLFSAHLLWRHYWWSNMLQILASCCVCIIYIPTIFPDLLEHLYRLSPRPPLLSPSHWATVQYVKLSPSHWSTCEALWAAALAWKAVYRFIGIYHFTLDKCTSAIHNKLAKWTFFF